MINVYVPSTYSRERLYILSIIFGELLGLDYHVVESAKGTDEPSWVIELWGQDGRLALADVFFPIAKEQWLGVGSLPVRPLREWRVLDDLPEARVLASTIPVIYGHDPAQSGFFLFKQGDIRLSLDVFGSAFFMFSRYEEAVLLDRDSHDRFPSTASIAYKGGFLDRPIIDEYVEILWAAMKRVWPGLKRKALQFEQKVSCDVDNPSRYALNGFPNMVKNVGIDVVKRGELRCGVIGPRAWLAGGTSLDPSDPYNTFEWMMDVYDKNRIQGAFYFIAGWTDSTKVQHYDIGMPAIRQLLRRIHDRGHEIGLHPSHNTYKVPKLLEAEAARLREVCAEEGICQDNWGGRMHWLRWETPTTLYGWEQAGMAYDSTLGYADMAGFRCGTCHEYPAFDPVKRQRLKLRIRPLISMESSVIVGQYMGLGLNNNSYEYFCKLKDACRLVNGKYTLLWHNSKLRKKAEKSMFQAVLEA